MTNPSKTWPLLLCLILFSFFFANQSPPVALAIGVEQRVTTHVSHQLDPAISGDSIVFTDLRNAAGDPDPEEPDDWVNSDIYQYDITSQTEFQVTTDLANQMEADVFGDFIVWEEYRNDGTPENVDVYLYDKEASQEIPITTVPLNQRTPKVSGYRVVWEDWRNGLPDIYLYDLSVDTDGDGTPNYIDSDRPNPDPAEVQLTAQAPWQGAPDIFGDLVVWQDNRNGNGDIYSYDLSVDTDGDGTPNYLDPDRPSPDPAESRITTVTSYEYDPAAYEGKIAWRDYRSPVFRNGDIYFYDFASPVAEGTQLTLNTALQIAPAIYGNWVVWRDNRDGTFDTNHNIYGYDLGSTVEIQITTDNSNQESPDLSGTRVVWEDDRTSNQYDIYLNTLLANPQGTIIIESGAASTTDPAVTVSNSISGATEMRFSADGATFTSWETYAGAKALTLPSLSGTKVVVGEFKGASGQPYVAFDSITLELDAPPAQVDDFTASDGEDASSTLSWTNPSDSDLSEVAVQRKVGTYPLDHTDGTNVYSDLSPTQGAAVNTPDSPLTNGVTYYYAVYSKDVGGNWNDVTTEGLNADTALPAAVTFTLTVSKTGTGDGTVTSVPSGINCDPDCSEAYVSGTPVTLTATADSDSIFTVWSGDPDCLDGQVTMDGAKSCTATFDLRDTTAPSIPQNVVATPIDVDAATLSWDASTDTGGSGLAGYRVYNTESGALVADTALTSHEFGNLVADDHSYFVKAYDVAENVSDRSRFASVRVPVRFSWQTVDILGSTFAANPAGATATASFIFEGDAVSVNYGCGLNTGIFEVSIDGAVVDTVDAYCSTPDFGAQKTYAVSPGGHKITIRPTGNTNPSSSYYWTLIDSFEVAGETYEEDDGVSYTWQTVDILGSTFSANPAGATASASFTYVGDSVSINYGCGLNTGIFDVEIDGALEETVDAYCSTPDFSAQKTYATAPSGTHTITVRPTGNTNPSSSYYWTLIDSFEAGGSVYQAQALPRSDVEGLSIPESRLSKLLERLPKPIRERIEQRLEDAGGIASADTIALLNSEKIGRLLERLDGKRGQE